MFLCLLRENKGCCVTRAVSPAKTNRGKYNYAPPPPPLFVTWHPVYKRGDRNGNLIHRFLSGKEKHFELLRADLISFQWRSFSFGGNLSSSPKGEFSRAGVSIPP